MKLRSLMITAIALMSALVFAQAPQNWFLDVVNPTDVEVVPNTENFTQGTKSCELRLLAPEVPYLISDNFEVAPGEAYTFSINVYDNDENGYLKLYADFYDADFNDIYGEDPVEVPDNLDQWQTITWSGVVPEGAAFGYILIKFYDGDEYAGYAEALIDDCKFEVNGENRVANGGFEEWGGIDMIKVYAAGEDMIVAVFDGDASDVSHTSFMLSGTEDITFGAAEIDSEMNYLVKLSDPSAPVTADLIMDKMTYTPTGKELNFYAGILPIAYLNANYPDGHIQSNGWATFRGIVHSNNTINSFWIHDAAGEYNGTMIYSNPLSETLNIGDEILLTGKRAVYGGNTEIGEAVVLDVVSMGNETYPATTIMGEDIQTGLPEDAESAE
jgi:hypothetical protein